MASVTLRGVRKSFGNIETIHGVDLDIPDGKFLVLVGPSGCGKSTLLRLLAGLEEVSGGSISIGERDVTDLTPAERGVAMVFQSYALYPHMTVAQNMGFGLEMKKLSKAEIQARVTQAAARLELTPLLDRLPKNLSGGQRQRVAIGRAIVRDPSVFLFDEPLSNLDAALRVDMRTEIKRLHQRTGATIVYVTHDQIEAMTLATKIAVLKDGLLQQVGTPAEIYNRPANLFVADFMGSPAMNLISAQVDAGGRISLERRGTEAITLPLPSSLATPVHAGQKVIFGIRPEAITDLGGADQAAKCIETVPAQVEVVEPAGADTFVISHLGGKEVIARMRADVSVAPGDLVPFAFNMDKALLFDAASGVRL